MIPKQTVCCPKFGGLSGRISDLGISGHEDVLLAMEAYNEAGGIKGRKIKLMVADDKQDPLLAVEAVKDLIEKDVIAIIGHMTTLMSMKTVPIRGINKFL